MNKSLFISLFGGSGSGKSTTAMGLTSKLKKAGYSCEYVSECVKNHVWDKNDLALDCQPSIAGEQIRAMHRLDGKVDIVITDSPILINLLHEGFGVTDNYKKWLLEVHNMFNNLNILLQVDRDKIAYESKGRYESLERAKEMDKENMRLLVGCGQNFKAFDVNSITEENIISFLKEEAYI